MWYYWYLEYVLVYHFELCPDPSVYTILRFVLISLIFDVLVFALLHPISKPSPFVYFQGSGQPSEFCESASDQRDLQPAGDHGSSAGRSLIPWSHGDRCGMNRTPRATGGPDSWGGQPEETCAAPGGRQQVPRRAQNAEAPLAPQRCLQILHMLFSGILHGHIGISYNILHSFAID